MFKLFKQQLVLLLLLFIMQFRYSLEDNNGNKIYEAINSLDTIIKYLDENATNATQYSVSITRNDNPDIVFYTRTEPLPNVNDNCVRNAYNLKKCR